MSTSYHFETDGQTKVLNRTLKQYLCAFIHDKPSQWFDFLTFAEWSYNTIVHSTTGISPFEATYSKPPLSLPQYLQGSTSIEAVDSLLSTRAHIHASLQCRLAKAQMAMKKIVDGHCRDVSYSTGDWVFVRLRLYRQVSIRPSYTKLSKRFYGSFLILERIDSNFRPPPKFVVFHVLLLKPYHGIPPPTLDPLPPAQTDNHP